MMRTALIVVASAGLAAAQLNYNETTGKFTCAQPNQAYCAGDSLEANIIVRCDKDAVGQPGNCNDNLAGEPPSGVQYSPCWQSSNTTGDAACSKNCVVYGGSGNYNGTFTLPAKDCTPTYTATSSSSITTTATTLTQSVTVSTSQASTSPKSDTTTGTATTVVGTATTTLCTENESSTASTGAVTGPSPSTITSSAITATTIIPPPAPPSYSTGASGAGSPPPGGSTAPKPSTSGSGPVVTFTSTSSVAAVSSTTFPTAGAVSNHVGVGLGVVGLFVGALL
ncbi:hypothetical protein Daus18300_003123 [Diaporthe australafricana]|uniref:Uncharacterized protein n=1 Tax=Diaporthe australafricana TaxID=127596 RepID=A0ABR3XI95_9PEZI